MRMAWSLSRDAEQLTEALAMRGIGIARVIAEEANESQRKSAFTKEIGNRAPLYREGEIVAVNAFGSVYRFNERTTGQLRDEIEKRLAGIYFGYPQAHEDDAERAVRAGLAVIEAVGRLPTGRDLRVDPPKRHYPVPLQFGASDNPFLEPRARQCVHPWLSTRARPVTQSLNAVLFIAVMPFVSR